MKAIGTSIPGVTVVESHTLLVFGHIVESIAPLEAVIISSRIAIPAYRVRISRSNNRSSDHSVRQRTPYRFGSLFAR